MTSTLDSPSAVLAAVADHHAELRARLAECTEAFIGSITQTTVPKAAAKPADSELVAFLRSELVTFLRSELLPHIEMENDLVYAAGRTEAASLLVRSMHDEHRMIEALIDEIDHASKLMDAAIAAGALVVLCDVRIEQENIHLLPALQAAGIDLVELLGNHAELVGKTRAAS